MTNIHDLVGPRFNPDGTFEQTPSIIMGNSDGHASNFKYQYKYNFLDNEFVIMIALGIVLTILILLFQKIHNYLNKIGYREITIIVASNIIKYKNKQISKIESLKNDIIKRSE